MIRFVSAVLCLSLAPASALCQAVIDPQNMPAAQPALLIEQAALLPVPKVRNPAAAPMPAPPRGAPAAPQPIFQDQAEATFTGPNLYDGFSSAEKARERLQQVVADLRGAGYTVLSTSVRNRILSLRGDYYYEIRFAAPPGRAIPMIQDIWGDQSRDSVKESVQHLRGQGYTVLYYRGASFGLFSGDVKASVSVVGKPDAPWSDAYGKTLEFYSLPWKFSGWKRGDFGRATYTSPQYDRLDVMEFWFNRARLELQNGGHPIVAMERYRISNTSENVRKFSFRIEYSRTPSARPLEPTRMHRGAETYWTPQEARQACEAQAASVRAGGYVALSCLSEATSAPVLGWRYTLDYLDWSKP